MIVCQQCGGNGATKGIENVVNPSPSGLYTATFQPAGSASQAPTIPCSQCNGKGYQTGGSF